MNETINKSLIVELMNEFIKDKKRRDIYNEFSFQHELGLKLRKEIEKIDKNYRVEFERNVSFFGITNKTEKKEIDIVIYRIDKEGCVDKKTNIIAIELKYHPFGCNVPQRMYDSLIDIVFMEQLKKEGFITFSFVISEDNRLFHVDTPRNDLSIYEYFRDKKTIEGNLTNEIGYKSKQRGTAPMEINGKYKIKWQVLNNSNYEHHIKERRYYLIKIK